MKTNTKAAYATILLIFLCISCTPVKQPINVSLRIESLDFGVSLSPPMTCEDFGFDIDNRIRKAYYLDTIIRDEKLVRTLYSDFQNALLKIEEKPSTTQEVYVKISFSSKKKKDVEIAYLTPFDDLILCNQGQINSASFGKKIKRLISDISVSTE